MEVKTPEPTGLVCPGCREPIAVIENMIPGIRAMHCPGCGNRWTEDDRRKPKE